MTTTRAALAAAVRPFAPDGRLRDHHMAPFRALADALGLPADPLPGDTPASGGIAIEPRWVAVARALIGTREIKGPRHAGLIANGWARLGAPWYNDDETPWCGLFAAHCLDAAGLDYPAKGMFARARSWLDWGKACPPAPGAIAVFGRDGGGHVGFAVGQSPTALYVLGGNQSDCVSIAPIARARLIGCRWPLALPIPTVPLPAMSGGTISTNEA